MGPGPRRAAARAHQPPRASSQSGASRRVRGLLRVESKTWDTRSRTQPSRRAWPRTLDRKSTRLNSSHITISYAVFCLKKKKKKKKKKKNKKNKKKNKKNDKIKINMKYIK